MPIIKKQDWNDWWDGMRSKAMKAGAESLTTNVGALLSTNGLANMKIPGLQDIGMGWKTAIATCLIQFTLRVVFAAAQYVANKPDPDVITETVETVHVRRDAVTGSVETGTSKTTTITPIAPIAPPPTPATPLPPPTTP